MCVCFLVCVSLFLATIHNLQKFRNSKGIGVRLCWLQGPMRNKIAKENNVSFNATIAFHFLSLAVGQCTKYTATLH